MNFYLTERIFEQAFIINVQQNKVSLFMRKRKEFIPQKFQNRFLFQNELIRFVLYLVAWIDREVIASIIIIFFITCLSLYFKHFRKKALILVFFVYIYLTNYSDVILLSKFMNCLILTRMRSTVLNIYCFLNQVTYIYNI